MEKEPFETVSVAKFLRYMDKFHKELPLEYYNRPVRELSRAALPFYVFDVEVLQHRDPVKRGIRNNGISILNIS